MHYHIHSKSKLLLPKTMWKELSVQPQKTRKKNIISYWAVTREPLTSMISVLPIILFYEIMAFVMRYTHQSDVINAADYVINNLALRWLFQKSGMHQLYGYSLLLAATLVTVLVYTYHSKKRVHLNTRIFGFMFLESLCYAALIGPVSVFLIQKFNTLLMLANPHLLTSNFQAIMLSLGAGFYEELVFRLAGVGGFSWLLRTGLRMPKQSSNIIAAIVTSLLFSIFHFWGNMGEDFTTNAFIFRSLAGLFFSMLYLGRGFGITVYTHTFYDLLFLLR
ncbi:CPBP family intramembrane metalloprotease [bacterium]|nr:CPBP family intramembrane metalloprotease [bacterium]